MHDTPSDPVDLASDHELADTAYLVAKVRERNREVPPPKGWDKLTCFNPRCGEDLPKERIAAGRFLCVPCKEIEEKTKGQMK